MKAKFLVLSGLLFAAVPAFAQDATPPAGGDASTAPAAAPTTPAASSSTTAPATGPMPKLWIGGGLQLAPQGSLSVSVPGAGSGSIGTDTGAYGIDVMALYAVHPMIDVGLAPRYILNITAGGSSDSASMYDIRAVGVIHKEIKPKLSVFGLAGVGYASISPPMGDSAAGATVSFGAGAGYSLAAKLIGTVSLQYELGFESVNSADEKFNFLSINLGVLYGAM